MDLPFAWKRKFRNSPPAHAHLFRQAVMSQGRGCGLMIGPSAVGGEEAIDSPMTECSLAT